MTGLAESATGNGRAPIPPAPTYLLERGFPESAITEVGWRVEPVDHAAARRYGLPANAVGAVVWVIPYRHRNGNIAFERIRLISSNDLERFGGGKYRQPKGHQLALYDPYLILGDETFEPRDWLLLIEGEANTGAARELDGELPVVGLPGQSALTARMAEQLAHIPCGYLWIDRHDPHAAANAQRIAERLTAAGVDEVRQLPPTPGRMDANDMLREGREQAREWLRDMIAAAAAITPADDADDWPLIPRPVPPPFPLEALGETLSAFVTALATQTQTAPDLAALGVLGVLAAVAMGAKVDCGNWEAETLGLYTLAVSPSGDRKSTVLKRVAAPLYRIEHQAREDAKARRASHESRLEVMQARKRALVAKLGKLQAEDEITAAERDLEHVTGKLAEASEFVEPRLLSDDATPEGLAELLSKHDSGIAVISAESAVIDNLLGHYSDQGKANLHVVCKAFNGEYASVDRRGRPPLILPRPLLSISLFAQPFVLENVLGHDTARGQGLIGRFILVDASASSYVGHRQIDPPPAKVPGHLIEAWDQIVRTVRTHISATEPTKPTDPESQGGFVGSVAVGEQELLTLSLSPSSKKLLTELELALEPRQADGADLATYRDWVSRHHGRIARIAGLLHLVERSPHEPIAVDTMRRALAIGEYVLAHGLLALSAPDDLLRRALAWLSRREDNLVSQRDIHHGFLGGHGKVSRAQELIEKLLAQHALRPQVGEKIPGPKGGRPKGPRYEINPHRRNR